MLLRTTLAIAAAASAALAQLPMPYVPVENPMTPEKVMLGKILFWDEQLSSDDSIACGTCHQPSFGGGDGRMGLGRHPGPDRLYGTSDDILGAGGVTRQASNGDFVPSVVFGLGRQVTGRSSPTNLGAGHHNELFWDGRAASHFDDPLTGANVIPFGGALESQALGPILNATEMAREGRTWADVVQKLAAVRPLVLATNVPTAMQAALQQNPTYPALFTAAFGDAAITPVRIAFALASYQRTLNPDDTPWDRHMAGQPGALTPLEQQGLVMFQTQAQCAMCHWEPLFSDDLFHNLGLRPKAEDFGRGPFSPLPEDSAAFKTPTLRNSGLKPALFHNGQSPPLGDPAQFTDPGSVLNIYLMGGGVDRTNLSVSLAPLLPLGVTANDVALALEFVRTGLTDARAAQRLPPFDHPDLRSVTAAPPRVFGPALAGASTPFLADTQPTYPGNVDFRLGISAGDGPGLALVTWGLQSIEPNWSFGGLPWHLHVQDWVPFVLQGQPGSPGHATWHLPIPGDPSLQQFGFYFQVLAADAQAPFGISSSRGYEFFVR
jgi:cytochrome c peroxidase